MNALDIWKKAQEFLDVDGDTVMLGYTVVVCWKTLHGGLGIADSAAYATAVGLFGYTKAVKK